MKKILLFMLALPVPAFAARICITSGAHACPGAGQFITVNGNCQQGYLTIGSLEDSCASVSGAIDCGQVVIGSCPQDYTQTGTVSVPYTDTGTAGTFTCASI